jgi:hypothetical protein
VKHHQSTTKGESIMNEDVRKKNMERKFFSLTTLSAVLLGLLMVASTSNLLAQTAISPAPAAPSITILYAFEPPPPYNQSNPGPTSTLFTIKFADATDGATIVYMVTTPSSTQSGTIAAPSSTTKAHGSVTVSLPVSNDSTGVASAYAYIPDSPPSPTTTEPF